MHVMRVEKIDSCRLQYLDVKMIDVEGPLAIPVLLCGTPKCKCIATLHVPPSEFSEE